VSGQVWDVDPSNLYTAHELAPIGNANRDDYNALPECVKSIITEKDYNGMGHEQRAALVEDLTTPDEEEMYDE